MNTSIVAPNWEVFKSKFRDNPQYYFEYLCYLLFCKEFNKPQGIFRYKNQAGIEWEPIKKGNKIIGVQCKFYDTKLSEHKDDFIKMLNTVHKKYPQINKLLIYTNQDWSQGKREIEPKTKRDIEQKAKEYGIELEWRTNESYFLSPDVFSQQELIKYFFSNDGSIYDLIERKQIHTEEILFNIKTNITYHNKTIEINRKKELNELKDKLYKFNTLIISGPGGVGKTAIIKKLFEEKSLNTPFYVFKASEFIKSVEEIFSPYNIEAFLKEHNHFKEKIVVIDSAEKLLEFEELSSIKYFISLLIKNNWKIIFTIRDNYLEVFQYNFDDLKIKPPHIFIDNLSLNKLQQLAKKYKFSLSNDEKLNELIKNPFYLQEYLNFFDKNVKNLNYEKFKDILWKKIIVKNKPLREECFKKIAYQRAKEGSFYLNENCSSIDEFLKEGILGRDEVGCFIAHDIYEEWALERIIKKAFFEKENNKSFFEKIGNSLPIRRAFRKWILDNLFTRNIEVQEFIQEVIFDEDIENYWKDEIIIAILLSDYSNIFFETFEDELLENDTYLLKKISFLLRLSCKTIDEEFIYQKNVNKIDLFKLFNKPKGKGWESFIDFVYKNKNLIELKYITFILTVLKEWTSKNSKGATTKKAALIALYYYEEIFKLKYAYKYSNFIKDIFQVVINGAEEIQEELKIIFEQIIKNKWKYHNDKYYELSKMILSTKYGIPQALSILRLFPDYVYKIATLFWTYTPEKNFNGFLNIHYNDKNENKAFGLEDVNCFPASALQTPIYFLLLFHQNKTFDFILNFINKCVEKYANSKWEESLRIDFLGFKDNVGIKEVDIFIDENTISKQFHSQALWNIYRGTSSPVTPYLLQSIHMALEKYLLELAKKTDSKTLEEILIYLLKNSKSSSISAVVTSIVLANPDKTFNVAKILFKTKEFFYADLVRWTLDKTEVQFLYGLGYGVNESEKVYQDERLKTCEDEHRKFHLESLFLNYQITKSKEITDEEYSKRKKTLWNILDNYYKELPPFEEQTENEKIWHLILQRMDIKKLNVKVGAPTQNIIPITFEIKNEKLKKLSNTSQKEINEKIKYNNLYLWSKYRLESNKQFKNYKEYEENPLYALKQLKEILKNGFQNALIQQELIPSIAIILLKDFNDLLDENDKKMCAEVVLEFSILPYNNKYWYQISDGTDIAIKYLPILYKYFPEIGDDIKFILLLNLFRDYQIGFSGNNVNDSAIKAIAKFYNEEEINNFILGYLYLKPKFDEILKTNNKLELDETIDLFEKKYQKDIKKFLESNLTLNDINFEVNSENLITIMKFIRYENVKPNYIFEIINEKILLKIFKNNFEEDLLKFSDKIDSYEQNSIFDEEDTFEERQDKINDVLKTDFFKSFAYLLLKADIHDTETYLKPLFDNFQSTEDIAKILLEIIIIQDQLLSYDNFWKVWQLFGNKIIEICKDGEYTETGTIIKTYLFAWSPYGEIFKNNAKEWHSLKDKNFRFFEKILKKISHCSSVLYSIAKLLNGIGSPYLDKGIFWISYILKNNPNLKLESEIRNITIYYLEIIIRKYILNNRAIIKKNKSKKNDILIILNFLIQNGSALAYMLREKIY
ncbi:AVAST type 4 anti-phage nuclease Avs4 [Caminibacter pacificus]